MQIRPTRAARWSLTLLLTLVLVLQNAGAALAPCRLGLEGHDCCGAHALSTQPSCCGGEDHEPSQDTPEVSKRDCTCKLFGDLPSLASSTSSEGASNLPKAALHGSTCTVVHECEGCGFNGHARARPPTDPPGTGPSSYSTRCAQLGSWRL